MRFLFKTVVFYSLCFIVMISFISVTPVQAANRGLSVPANQLPNELKGADIKDYYAGSGTTQAGTIQTVIGHVVVAREKLRAAYYAAPGDKLFEKDIIFTLKGSKCRFKLVGEDVVTMGENTRIGVKSFQANQQRSTKSSVFTLARGKAMFYALRLFKHRSNSMAVETPTSVSGVRGTKWGVEVVEVGARETASAPMSIQIADTSDLGFRMLAQANAPSTPQFQTTILCFSGTVFTGSTAASPPKITLSQGQMTTVRMNVPPSPPVLIPISLAGSFTAETYVPPPGDASGPTQPLPFPPGAYRPVQPPSLPPDMSSVVQQQNVFSQERPVTHWGYYYNDFVEVKPDSSIMSQGALWTDYPPANLDEKQYVDGKVRYPPSHAATKIELGYNAYAEWGYWATAPWTYIDAVEGNITVYEHTGYIQGDLATSAQISALKSGGIVGNYAGTAFGVHRTNGSASMPLMQGTFSATINFANSAVSNFNISVSGSGKSAGITGAAGSLSGTGSFQVTGPAFVSGNDPGSGTAYGSVYGSSGQAVGGSWIIMNSPYSTWAGGIFQGRR